MQELFEKASALPRAAQEAFLERACAGDVGLLSEVRSLLALADQNTRIGPFSDRAIVDAREMIGKLAAGLDVGGIEGGAAVPIGEDGLPENIGPYKMLELLGEGGFGLVYMAEQDKPIRRRVALKIIKLGMDTRQVVARFEAERQALALMDHPNIAKVYDAGATEKGRPYFVMELVRGLPITDYCDRKKLGLTDRLELAVKICEALQHAHQKGVIHRDIKPNNVLVSEGTVGDGKPIPKIIDFGIAKATSARLGEKTIFTESRQMIGTPEYMSPEQAGESHEDMDTRTDVYSTGVLLYELLTGATPFDSERLRSAAFGELQRIIREEDPPRPSTRLMSRPESLQTTAALRAMSPAKLPATIRGELDWIVMKAIEKDRSRRYDSAGAMGRDIQRYLTGHAVHAAPPSTAYQVRKFVRRNRGPVLAGALILLVLIAGLVGTGIGYRNAQRQRAEAEGQRRAALAAGQRADDNARLAGENEARANRSAYSANLLSACASMASNQYLGAKGFLDAAPESLRGWEWHTLHARLDTSIRTLDCPMSGWTAGEAESTNALLPHPDGRSFLTIRRNEIDAAQRRDAATGQVLARYARPLARRPEAFTFTYFDLSSDSSTLWAYSGSAREVPECTVSAWNLATNERILRKVMPPIPDAVGVVCIVPDARTVIRNDEDTLWVQDIDTGEVRATAQRTFTGYRRLSADGSLLALAGMRGEIEVVDTRTLAVVASLNGHRNLVHGIEFSHDGRYLASAAIDGFARVWDFRASPPTAVVLEHPCAVDTACFSPDASLVATIGTDCTIRVWDTRSGELRGLYTSGKLIPSAIMFMPDGRTIAGRERDGTVRFWDVTAESTVNLRGHMGILNGAAFIDKVGIIASAGWDGWRGHPGCVRLWDAETGDEIASLGMPGEVAYIFAASPNATRVAVSITKTEGPWTPRELNFQSRVDIIDLARGRLLSLDRGNTRAVQSVGASGLAFDPAGEHLAIGFNGGLEIRDAATGAVIRTRTAGFEQGIIGTSAWSPNGRLLACINGIPLVSSTRDLLILDPDSLDTIRRIDGLDISALGFSPDSTQLAAGGSDGKVHLINPATGEVLRTLEAHQQAISAIAFNPDGTRLATVGGTEGDIIVWNTQTWDRVAKFHEDDHVAAADWDSTGHRLLGACGRTIRIWDDVPLRERVREREQRLRLLAEVTPKVEDLFTRHSNAEFVAAAIDADLTLSERAKRAARQVMLARVLRNVELPASTKIEMN